MTALTDTVNSAPRPARKLGGVGEGAGDAAPYVGAHGDKAADGDLLPPSAITGALPPAVTALRRRHETRQATAIVTLTESIDVPEIEPERQVNRRRAYTHDECIALAKVWERETGAPPTQAEWNPALKRKHIMKLLTRIRAHRDAIEQYEEGGYPSSTTVRKLFGSWNAFMHSAGWTPREGGRQATVSAIEPPPTPTREQVRRRVGQQAQRSPWGRDALARVVRNVIEADAQGDREALKGVLLEGAAQLLAWADSIPDLPEASK